MRIKVSNVVSLVDQLVTISVSGCSRMHPVTLHLTATEPYGKFSSHAHFLTDADGEVSTDRDRSVGGTYSGLDQMGLFWSMQPDPGQKIGLRLLKRNASEPISMHLRALTGHQTKPWEAPPSSLIDEITLQRTYLSPEVSKTSVEVGRLRGTLFAPTKSGTYPGVLDLFGIGGGLIEHRASLLASRGFTVLALAYFGYKDLPNTLSTFELEYFVDAIKYLLDHPKVRGPKVGVIGTSAGANGGAELAILCKEVACVAWINGWHCRLITPLTYQGQTWPALKPHLDRAKSTKIGDTDVWVMKDCYDVDCTEEYTIPIEKSDAEFLFISSMDDEGVPSYTGQLMAERLARAGKKNFRLIQYHGAGHMLEPPHSPLNRIVYQGAQGGVMDYGGNPYWHNLAQVDSWEQILKFLRRNLEQVAQPRI